MLSRIKSYFCFLLVRSGNCFYACSKGSALLYFRARHTLCKTRDAPGHHSRVGWIESHDETPCERAPSGIIIKIWNPFDRMMLNRSESEFETGTRFRLARSGNFKNTSKQRSIKERLYNMFTHKCIKWVNCENARDILRNI